MAPPDKEHAIRSEILAQEGYQCKANGCMLLCGGTIMLPATVYEAWENRQKAIVLTTVDDKGMPNSIWATCADMYEKSEIVVANNYFDKTMKNIEAGTLASVLFITTDGTSYQLKGTMSYHTEGFYYDFMKAFNPTKHPGHGAAVLHVLEAYSGSKALH
jgi:hypothetical protein